ncbi:ABC transporter [Truncatella angustata]|uniref:ABC transporter n=1 Tax=Truncatella angustata TaxID=152316 RepID=A0A9P8UG22_9PEZI|nr:ABC transporter [Truncatella angustata]KAH6651607.1 ABC transporter [Truncatella angustata]
MNELRENLADSAKQFLAGNEAASSTRSSVVFDRLSVVGSGRGVQAAPTVWTTLKSWSNIFNPRLYGQTEPSRTLLHEFSGSLASGEMLLVVGKPGSGCTTFLKALANMGDEYKSVTGQLTYGGRPADDCDPDRVRLTFCAEEDNHLPTLTVAQTLRFAVRATWDAQASGASVDAAVESLAKCVGLSHVLKTKVGNAAIRGVSGGERRRVSLAEAMATCPDVLCLDNPTNGLDSATALDFVQMTQEFTTQHGCSTVMSVYQGSNAMVPLFDKVLVISGGRQIFYGRATHAKAYFESLGFICPDRTTVTDFLNSMTAEPELRHVRKGWQSRVPSTSAQFEDAFRHSEHYNDVIGHITAERSKTTVVGPKRKSYALPLYRQILECCVRQFRVLALDTNTWMTEAVTIIVQSLVLGTLFRDQPRATRSLFILSSSLFNSVLVPALQSMGEFSNSFAERPLVIRQKRYRFYRPAAYALGLVLTDAVWKVIAIAYNIPQYFLTGFQRTADKFFTWFCIVYVLHMALSMVFRAIAVSSRNMARAVLPVGIMFNIFVLYTGLYVPGPQMQVWLFWIKYCNPLYYAYESAMVNEFGNLYYTCSDMDLVPNGNDTDSIAYQVCSVQGSVSGQALVSGAAYMKAQYGFQTSNLWRNVGINAAFFVFFALCTCVGMDRYKLPAGHLATIFYKTDPKSVDLAMSSNSSDTEKGATDQDTPPVTTQPSLPFVASHNGRMLAWENLTLELKVGSETKRLLDNLSGFVEPGKLTTLMGASGAGKTTLLNTLAGRLEFGTLSGNLSIDGGPLPKSFRRYMGYVQQQDVHLPSQTVREALQMTAHLRRSLSVPNEEKDSHVEAVIRTLEMEDIADALIGVPGAGLNLEQRKRVTIGVELSARPDILILDEPTSGLDGQSALTIGRLLRKLADSGQTVLCTIHQPAMELINLFDHLVLLVPGGRLAYDGPLGDHCTAVLEYLVRVGSVRPCRPDENPAEYLVQAVRGEFSSGPVDKKPDYPAIWQASEERVARESQRESLISAITHPETATHTERTHAVPLNVQFMTTMRRTWLYYWREPDYFVSKLLMNMGNALLNGLTFLNAGNNERGAYNRLFSAFMSLIVGPPLGLQLMPRFVALRDIFTQREQASLSYSWLCFVVPAILVELPFAFITSLVYWLLWYFPVGYFTDPAHAGYSFLMYELFSVFAHSLAQLCAVLMPSLNAALMANGFFFMFVNCFAGTLSPKPSTPTGWRWYYDISPLFYFSEGTTADMLYDLEITCEASEAYVFQIPSNGTTCQDYAKDFLQTATGYLLNPGASSDCQYCRYKNGQSYYSQWGYDFANRYRNIGIFIAFIAFNYTAVIMLTYLTKVKKWKRE